jgi:hypothetical protein
MEKPRELIVSVAPLGGKVKSVSLDISHGKVPTVKDALCAADVDDEIDQIFINEDNSPKNLDTQLYDGDLITVTIKVNGGLH